MMNADNSNANFSLFHGFRFKFTVEDKQLLYLASAWTGKELVIYDGEEISRTRNYQKTNSHYFLINDVAYRITFTVDSLLKGGWHCCLFRNERTIECFDLYLENISFFRQLLYGITLGFILSFTPKYLWFICIPIAFVVAPKLVVSKLKCKVRLGDSI